MSARRPAARLLADRRLLPESLPGRAPAAGGGRGHAGVSRDPADRHKRPEESDD